MMEMKMERKLKVYQKQKAGDGLDLSWSVALRSEGQVGKHNSHYYSHPCSTYQENIPVLQFFCSGKLKDKAIVYSCLPPLEDIAAIKEQMQE